MRQTVLFVCLHGSAKSLIAVHHFRRLVAERRAELDADTAGTEPDAEVPPNVVAGLAADGFDVRAYRPRRVTADDLHDALHVVSFGCDLTGVAPPGRTIERWDDVPLVSEDYVAARDAIVSRLDRLLDRLPAS